MASPTTSSSSGKKKPLPLFGLFRKMGSKPSSPTRPAKDDPYAPDEAHKQNFRHSPLTPPPPIASTSCTPVVQTQYPATTRRRPRSKSSAAADRQRATLPQQQAAHRARSLVAREQTLNKLCQRERTPSPTSPNMARSPVSTPPLPPMPTLRKVSSAHNLQRITRHQQTAIRETPASTMPHPKQQRKPLKPHIRANLNSTVRTSQSANLIHEDDDDKPLAYMCDEDDRDLVPIAMLQNKKGDTLQTAADKYKQRVMEQLRMAEDSEEEDNIPISMAHRSPRPGRRRPALDDIFPHSENTCNSLPQAV
ncbi:hypothetical protein BCR43DRAFT_494462 [Syncephalastrum racemosum]|uniref:Uncharacterized protein n=1 Tax=Syncephalastrum racemosum TaxID=13706 RepID=A0A1X2H804_SYNRA|nr:hypothetical protein BCR43DRAFT_494462 [Syncephalastrum racemosum]